MVETSIITQHIWPPTVISTCAEVVARKDSILCSQFNRGWWGLVLNGWIHINDFRMTLERSVERFFEFDIVKFCTIRYLHYIQPRRIEQQILWPHIEYSHLNTPNHRNHPAHARKHRKCHVGISLRETISGYVINSK